MKSNFLSNLSSLLLVSTLTSCSFVEPLPGDHHITQVNKLHSDDCQTLKEVTFETKTTTFFLSRSPVAIADELQTLARNDAIQSYANAIWPMTEVKNGKQSFLILRCARN